MTLFTWTVIFFLIQFVAGETQNGCLVYDFESDLEQLKHDAAICEPFPEWTVGNYSEIGMRSPNPVSKSFITPASVLSCISTKPFRAFGGVVEINVFLDGKSSSDILQALLMMSSEGNDVTVATASLSPYLNDATGWHTLKLNVLEEHGVFEGYIAFLGLKSDESIYLVDSLKYVPPTADDKTCLIYEDEDATPDTLESVTNKPNNQNNDQCMTYNFEEDFEILFSLDNYLCDGYPSWKWGNYTSTNVKSPEIKSSLFIKPSESLSCISSFVFTMEPDGVIEANVYIDPMSDLDHIIVIAQKVTTAEVDTVTGFTMYYPENLMFVRGWNVLTFPVVDFSSFEGYLIFFGSATEGSTVIVDSVRYIPPSLSSLDKSCSFY